MDCSMVKDPFHGECVSSNGPHDNIGFGAILKSLGLSQGGRPEDAGSRMNNGAQVRAKRSVTVGAIEQLETTSERNNADPLHETGSTNEATSSGADVSGLGKGDPSSNQAFQPRQDDTVKGDDGLFPEYAKDPVYEAVYKLGVEGNKLSARRDREYSAFGGIDANGKIVFQQLAYGTTARLSEAPLEGQSASFRRDYPGASILYSFHTHGSDFDLPGGYENFSGPDRNYYQNNKNVGPIIGFLATPRGLLLMYDPNTKSTVQIGRIPIVQKPLGK
jgi:hypothetical protein